MMKLTKVHELLEARQLLDVRDQEACELHVKKIFYCRTFCNVYQFTICLWSVFTTCLLI